jgi:aldehyde dehydrogenase (NAD+)
MTNEIRWSPAQLIPEHCAGWIGANWVTADLTVLDVEDPALAEPIMVVAEADAALVDRATQDSERAFRSRWRDMPGSQRGRLLAALASAVRREATLLATAECVDTGKPLSQARADVEVAARFLEYFAGAADKVLGEVLPQADDQLAYTVLEPYGVVAHVTPWNAPLSQMMRGVAPCLAAGNAVVVKPSELTPVSTLLVAKLFVEAGLPEGVCNVVIGRGWATGTELVSHPSIRHITFTGSVATGRTVGRIAADRIVGVNLELGGKSPTIVCADADLDAAAAAAALAVIRNSGQSCFATTRILVQDAVHDDLVERIVARLSSLRLGHGLDDPDVGPLVSADQVARVDAYLSAAAAEGAQPATPVAHRVPDTLPGHFMAPVLLVGVTNDMAVAQEEVFGPVQCVLPYGDIDEAISMANDTTFGLGAGIFTASMPTAQYAAKRLQAGQVQINRYAATGVDIPFGGYKSSGIGREKGLQALHSYTQSKSVIWAH